MISKNDEFLHDYTKSPDWEESFRINFADKKNKLFGCVDISYYFSKKKIVYGWVVYSENTEYTYINEEEFDGKRNDKQFNFKGLKYHIKSPVDKCELKMKNSAVDVSLVLSGIFPVYNYPAAAHADYDEKREFYETNLWKRYEQRCKVQGSITYKTGEKKGKTKKVECFGQREHLWGARMWKQLTAFSCYSIQFKEMAISLSYLNFNGVLVPNGFISMKSGNIPISEVEMEHIDLDPKSKLPKTTEISYLDSQDDRDLIVANQIYSIEMPDKIFSKRKFRHFRNFSEFTIIGASKKGVGMEDHYIFQNSLADYTAD